MRAKKRRAHSFKKKLKSHSATEILDSLRVIYDRVEVLPKDSEQKKARLYVYALSLVLNYQRDCKLSEEKLFHALNHHATKFMRYKQEFTEEYTDGNVDSDDCSSFVAMSMIYMEMALESGAADPYDTDSFADAITEYVGAEMRKKEEEYDASLADNLYEDVFEDEGDPSERTFRSTFSELPPSLDILFSNETMDDHLVKFYGAFSDVKKPDNSFNLEEKVRYYVRYMSRSFGVRKVSLSGVDVLSRFVALTLDTVKLFLNDGSFEEDLCLFLGCLFFYHEIGLLKGVWEKPDINNSFFHQRSSLFVVGIQEARMRLRLLSVDKLSVSFPVSFKESIVGDSLLTMGDAVARECATRNIGVK